MSDDTDIMPGLRQWAASAGGARACNCIGPQNGQPKCPCMMANVVKRDGRWIEKERDLGPVITPRVRFPAGVIPSHGCICPPGAEATCKGVLCPRRPIGSPS